MTSWFFVIVLVLVMGGIALVAAGRGAPMADDYDDRPDALVPAAGDLGPEHLRRVRFTLGFRGYRMSEVDALLSRLATQLEAHQAWQPSGEPDQAPAVDLGAGFYAPAAPAAVEDPADPSVSLDKDAGPERRTDGVPPG